MNIDLRVGDSLQVLKDIDANSVDSVVTDPPYGLSFMGKKWDYDVPTTELWEEVLRVLKPGGHLLSFSSSRTYHRMAVAVEDAGFDIRDQIMWVYGSGFPKSHNIGKKLDTHEGWGTALKPAHEPIVLARKPFKGTVVDNVIKHGTGGINIDKSRVAPTKENYTASGSTSATWKELGHAQVDDLKAKQEEQLKKSQEEGRFPANFIHSGIDEDWSRFFYCAKVSKAERNVGLTPVPVFNPRPKRADGTVIYKETHPEEFAEWNRNAKRKDRLAKGAMEEKFHKEGGEFNDTKVLMNTHPTVKPVKLMSYLVNLVTPEGGIVLDPFMGSGSTGMACKQEGYSFIGIDLDEDYVNIAKARIEEHNK